jgi:hypothetical protein
LEWSLFFAEVIVGVVDDVGLRVGVVVVENDAASAVATHL